MKKASGLIGSVVSIAVKNAAALAVKAFVFCGMLLVNVALGVMSHLCDFNVVVGHDSQESGE